MNKNIGRNDPCPCGSGKKYKQCCLAKANQPKKLTAKWLNAPQVPNLMERTFGSKVNAASKIFTPVAPIAPDANAQQTDKERPQQEG